MLVVNTGPENGSPGAFVESDDPRVFEWADDLIASYREEAERLETDAFA